MFAVEAVRSDPTKQWFTERLRALDLPDDEVWWMDKRDFVRLFSPPDTTRKDTARAASVYNRLHGGKSPHAHF
jgi:hypothetical protein